MAKKSEGRDKKDILNLFQGNIVKVHTAWYNMHMKNTRSKIFDYIRKSKGATPTEISEVFSIRKEMTHRHLKKLLDEDLVEKEGSAPKVIYLEKDNRKTKKESFKSERFKISRMESSEENILKLTLDSAKAKDKKILIYEIESLEKFLSKKNVEKARLEFLKNKVDIFQLTNSYSLDKFKKNKIVRNRFLNYRYISGDIFTIEDEILLFDDVVAFYNEKEIVIIEDKILAKNQRQLFQSVWDSAFFPRENFTEEGSYSVYDSVDIFPQKIHAIVWPDADARKSFGKISKNQLEKYMENIISTDKKFFENLDYLIIVMWALEEEGKSHKMLDVWKFTENYVDDRSGPISAVRVYKDGVRENTTDVASGSTLLVLAYEEKLRRQSKDLESYLKFSENQPNQIRPPFGICNNKDFFAHNE